MSDFNEYIEEGYNPTVGKFYKLIGRIDYGSVHPDILELILDMSDAIERSNGGIFHDVNELEKDLIKLKDMLGGK